MYCFIYFFQWVLLKTDHLNGKELTAAIIWGQLISWMNLGVGRLNRCSDLEEEHFIERIEIIDIKDKDVLRLQEVSQLY